MPVINPPVTAIKPVNEVLHGREIVDPYRWLEEQNSPETRAWIFQQTEYARRYLDVLPDRDRIRKRVADLLGLQSFREIRKAGERCFFLRREPSHEQPVLVMREGDSEQDIVLLDPVQLDGSPQASVSMLATSPTGKFLAFAFRIGGHDSAPIRFLDVDKRQVLGDFLPAGICGGLVLSDDPRGFYYVHRALDAPPCDHQTVLWHTLGTAFEEDRAVFSVDDHPGLRLLIAATCGSHLFLYMAAMQETPAHSDFFLHDIENGCPARRILENVNAFFLPFFVGRKLLAVTDFQAPNHRIVAIDPENPDPTAWQTVVREREFPIVQFAVARDLLCLVYLENLAHKILTFDVTGKPCGELKIPTDGTVRLFWQSGQADTLFYQYSSFTQPLATFRYRPGEEAVAMDPVGHACSDTWSFDIERVLYPAKDETQVPMFIVSKKGGSNGPRPVFLTAYGGFGKSLTPQFAAYATILMELGCLVAVANVRGGGEFGQAWHEAAKRQKRQTAIDDFLSAAQWLITKKIVVPERLAIGGGSNAALLVGAALTQRPDLFRAALCLGPLLDMLRYHKFDMASQWIDEFGSADIPEDFHALYSYSPYHRVRDNIPYPSVMFISGDADMRCNPMHARKMTARLQAASSSNRPILLDYRPAWGHIPVQPLSARIEALTDRLLFLFHELDMSIPEGWS